MKLLPGGSREKIWLTILITLILFVSIAHYLFPGGDDHFNLFYMQTFLIPVLIGAFQFGIKGGLGSSLAITAFYCPRLLLQFQVHPQHALLEVINILVLNIIAYFTGKKAQQEFEEKRRYQQAAEELKRSITKQKLQSQKLTELKEQISVMDRLALVGELTASLAHEIRNPLGSIQGTVEILRDELPEDWKESEFFRILLEESLRLNGVVENYLNLTRLTDRSLSMFDAAEVIRTVIMILSPEFEKKEISVEFSDQDQDMTLNGNRAALSQALINLMQNAIQSIDQKGTITIMARREALDSPVQGTKNERQDQAGGLRLEISDNGCGINPENLEKIFQPLYTTRSGGTGLGLTIVKRIADENQWRLSVKSRPGQGTTFVIYLPVKPLQK